MQLLVGMLSVIFCTGVWLILATYFELPVSTTHSCVGGVIGIAVMAKGWGAVHWSGVFNIVASWVVSPILTGLLGAGLLWVSKPAHPVGRPLCLSQASLLRLS